MQNLAVIPIGTQTIHSSLCAAQGVGKDTRGTAFVVYEDIYDAKMAVEHLSGFNVANRYLIVLYYNPARQTKKVGAPRARLTVAVVTDSEHHSQATSVDVSLPSQQTLATLFAVAQMVCLCRSLTYCWLAYYRMQFC